MNLSDERLTINEQPQADRFSPLGADAPYSTSNRPHIHGLYEIWYGTGFENSLASSPSPNARLTPQGRNFGARFSDTFRPRRVQFAIDGGINKTIYYGTKLDFAATGSGSGGVLQDLWVGFELEGQRGGYFG